MNKLKKINLLTFEIEKLLKYYNSFNSYCNLRFEGNSTLQMIVLLKDYSNKQIDECFTQLGKLNKSLYSFISNCEFNFEKLDYVKWNENIKLDKNIEIDESDTLDSYLTYLNRLIENKTNELSWMSLPF